MAVTTLGDLVNDILTITSGDEVSNIVDSPEAQQIGSIIELTYEYLQQLREWPHKRRVINLGAATNSCIIECTVPSLVTNIESIRYSVPRDASAPSDGDTWKLIEYLEPYEWLDKVKTDDADDTTLTTVQIEDPDGNWPATNVDIYIQNDKEPEYWTSFNDKLVYFDSVNTDREANIDDTKTLVDAYVTFTLDPDTDNATIEVPDRDWPLFRAMCITRVREHVHESVSPTAQAEARRLLIQSQIKGTTTQRPRRYGINNGRT